MLANRRAYIPEGREEGGVAITCRALTWDFTVLRFNEVTSSHRKTDLLRAGAKIKCVFNWFSSNKGIKIWINVITVYSSKLYVKLLLLQNYSFIFKNT